MKKRMSNFYQNKIAYSVNTYLLKVSVNKIDIYRMIQKSNDIAISNKTKRCRWMD